MNENIEKKMRWSFLIKPSELDKIKNFAKIENRSINNFITNSVKEYIKDKYEKNLIDLL